MRIVTGSFPGQVTKARMFVGSLTADERRALEWGRKSADALTARRPQVIPARASGLRPSGVVGCITHAARTATQAFEADRVGYLAAESHARKYPGRVWDRGRDDGLRDLLHPRPREFGKATCPWAVAVDVRHRKEGPGCYRARRSARR